MGLTLARKAIVEEPFVSHSLTVSKTAALPQKEPF